MNNLTHKIIFSFLLVFFIHSNVFAATSHFLLSALEVDFGIFFAIISSILLIMLGIYCFLNQQKVSELKVSLKDVIISSQKMEANLEVYSDLHLTLQKKQEQLDQKNLELQKKEALLRDTEDKIKESNKTLEDKSDQLDQQNQALFLAQKKIRQSQLSLKKNLSYARRMQQAVLPPQGEIQEYFEDFFIINRAKEYVSGDFYWVNEADNKVFIVVADCTGHGIQGGFLTLVANTLLNEIILQYNILDTDQILSALHVGFQNTLGVSEDYMDGMNLSICRIENMQAGVIHLQFSGARSMIYYIHDGQLHELKGDRQRVGGLSNNKKRTFTKHTLTLAPGDNMYFFTDGLTNLHNKHGVKFGYQRLKDLILKYHNLKLPDQQSQLKDAFKAFCQDSPVRDDLTLMGIQLKDNLIPRISKNGVVVKAPKKNNNKYFNFFEYYTMINDAQVILSYKGPFTDVLLSEVSRDIRQKIQDNPKVGKKIFSIFMELAQNVLFYSKEMNHFGNNDRVGTLVILDAGQSYLIMTGNLIFKTAIDFLQDKCEKVNSLDRDALREYKRNLRNAPKSEESRGAGIGIIHAALTSDNPLEYEIKEFGEDHAFFLLTVNVAKSAKKPK